MLKMCASPSPNKEIRLTILQEMLDPVSSYQNILTRVVTGDESWVFQYDPTTKQQGSDEQITRQDTTDRVLRL